MVYLQWPALALGQMEDIVLLWNIQDMKICIESSHVSITQPCQLSMSCHLTLYICFKNFIFSSQNISRHILVII